MYADIPFWLAIAFMLGGLWLLAWSANLFVDGAEAVALSLGDAYGSNLFNLPPSLEQLQ